MTLLLTWLLITWGLTSILTRSRLLRPLRDRFAPGTFFGDLARCDQCMGLWVGLGLSLGLGLGGTHALRMGRSLGEWSVLVEAVLDGVVSSAACAMAGAVTDWLKAAAVRAAMG